MAFLERYCIFCNHQILLDSSPKTRKCVPPRIWCSATTKCKLYCCNTISFFFCSLSFRKSGTSQRSWDSSFLACTKSPAVAVVSYSQLSLYSGLLVRQPEVLVAQKRINCLKTFPRQLLVFRKKALEQVFLFAHTSLEVLPYPHKAIADDCHKGLDRKNVNLQPFARVPSLLDFAWIFLPIKHMFSFSKVGDKLYPCSKISTDIFSLQFLCWENLAWLMWMSADLDLMEVASGTSLCPRPVANSMAFLPLRVTWVFSLSPRSSRKSLHIAHSIECLHIVRIVDSHIRTNRLRIHLECVDRFMKF